MTWFEFKIRMEELGIKNEDIVEFLSTDYGSDKVEDFNTNTVEMIGPSTCDADKAVNCWNIYV